MMICDMLGPPSPLGFFYFVPFLAGIFGLIGGLIRFSESDPCKFWHQQGTLGLDLPRFRRRPSAITTPYHPIRIAPYSLASVLRRRSGLSAYTLRDPRRRGLH